MTPPTVNAYYDPLKNNINFPAGILQPPFFNKAADDAVNFGAVGMVIGHELTHGFDDQGRQFDAQGNLSDWWTPEDGKAFEERAACVEKQYSDYTAIGDVKLNGKLTLGENVADNGGLRIAWMALMETAEDEAARHRGRLHAASSASSSAGRRCGARTRATRSPGCTRRPTRIPRAVPDQRRRRQHAGVCEGVQLSGHCEDGSAAGVSSLVMLVGLGLMAHGSDVRQP